jgi:hypothetical protein
MRCARVLGAMAAVAVAGALATPAASAGNRAAVPGAPGCAMFPADSWWHSDISSLPVHPRSDVYVASMGVGGHVHADFGSGLWDGGPIGIPYVVVDSSQPAVPVAFDYADESDPGPYRVPPNAPIEGGPASGGDRHVLVVDRGTCQLAELYAAHPDGHGGWTAGSGATWDLRSNALRPDAWTSADAAGLPILPGLVRYDEVAAGHIDHAIRVTANATARSHLWPARHDAGSANANLPPMGLRLRLKANVGIGAYPAADQVIMRAMKTYGVVIADNGSSWFVSGAPDERWDNDVLHALGQLTGSAFEAVDASSLMVSAASGQARAGVAATAPTAPTPTTRRAPATTAVLPATTASTTTTPSTSPSTMLPGPAFVIPDSPTTSAVERATGATITAVDKHASGRGWWLAATGGAATVAVLGAVWARRRSRHAAP